MNDQTTTRARDGRHRISTRALLACAAIGAAGGLVVAPITVFSSSGPALALPLIYALLAMVKLLPGVLAQTLLRFPGAALLTGVIVGLINIPFSAHGPMVFVSLAGIGLLQEIVPAALLYRRWGIGVLLAGSVVAGAVLGLLGWRALASSETDLTVAIGYWAVCAVAAVAVTFIGFWIGERVRRSGVVAAAS
jgi:energy-coupling factor transport system substrate-specific component